MTAKEALIELKACRRFVENLTVKKEIQYDFDMQAFDFACKALEKQIQKKLITEGDGYCDGLIIYDRFYCPSCDYLMEEDEVEGYCPKCGQKLENLKNDKN